MASDPVTDYRFTLANERTFLAYVRTAVAFQVAGLGALQFLTSAGAGVRHSVGLAMVAMGLFVGVVGLVRRRAVERAMADAEPLPPSRSAPVLLVLALVVPVVAGVLLVTL